MSSDPLSLELVARYERLRRRGHAITPEELCRDCPDKLDEVRRRIDELHDLQRRLDTDPETRAATSAPPGTGGTGGEVAPSTAYDLPPSRYRPVQFHAGGGMGEVYLAEDTEFDRKVALKRIKAKFAANPDSRRRFLLEAEVTAGLEHPGIVPVYGKGRDEAGAPCYAMRFLQGGSLHDAIQRFHDADTPGRDPGERRLELRQLLACFVAVCKTVAYAHSRGIIHRDLKPANVMLGKYGETLVVDWGLARRFQRTETERASGEETLPPIASGSDSATEAGRALGTPAYMSPEQARGDWDRVGPASDIYGLGAVLHALLSGQPPFQGTDANQVLERVKRGDRAAPPRQVKKACPPPLEAVCLKAMAPEPQARYATALELAADVEHWLGDEPVSAWQEPWSARLGRWARRHRPLVAGLTAVLGTALVLGTGGGLWLWRERELRQQGDLRAALEKQNRALRINEAVAQAGLDLHQQNWLEADREVRRARGLVGAGEVEEAQRQAVDQVARDVGTVFRLEEVRIQRCGMPNCLFNYDKAPPDAVFRDDGIDVLRLPPGEAGRLIQESPIAEELVDALDDWAWVLREWEPERRSTVMPRLIEAAQAADPDPARGRLRRALLQGDAALKAVAAELRPEAMAGHTSPTYLVLLANVLAKVGEVDRAIALLHQADVRYPANFWINVRLAELYRDKGQGDDAIRHWTVARAQRPDNFIVVANLAASYAYKGDLENAMTFMQESIRLRPDDPRGPHELGILYLNQHRFPEAMAADRKALAIDPNYAPSMMNLGLALSLTGQAAEGEKLLRQVVALLKQKVGQQPADDALQANYALGLLMLGDLLQRTGKPNDALEVFQEAVEVSGPLFGKHPDDPHVTQIEKDARTQLTDVRVRALCGRGQHADAAATADKAHQLAGKDTGQLYDIACWYALCSAAVAPDKPDDRLSPDERALREKYAARAVDVLREAVQGGFKDAAHLKIDHDLDALRQRDDFRKLLADLEKKAAQ